MNPHLGPPQSPPSSSTNLSRQLQLLPAQVAQLSLAQSPPSRPSTYSTKIYPTSESKKSPKALLPLSNTAIPSIALKPTLLLAQIRSSKRRLLRSKPRSPITTKTPSVPTISLPTRDKSPPRSRSARVTRARPSGFVSETTARWSFSPGRTIMRFRTSPSYTQIPPTTSTDQSRLCPPGSSSSSTGRPHHSTHSARQLRSSTTGEISPKSSDTDTSMTPSASSTQSSIKYVPNSSWLKSGSRVAAIVSKPPASLTKSATSKDEPTPASNWAASPSLAPVRASTPSASASTQESQTRERGGVTASIPEKYSFVLLPL